jgi:hypothetical protein
VPKRNCVLFSDIWILYRVMFSLANVNICGFKKLMANVAILNQKVQSLHLEDTGFWYLYNVYTDQSAHDSVSLDSSESAFKPSNCLRQYIYSE